MIPPLIMPASALFQIDHYREYVCLNTQTTNTLNHGGSGDEQGRSSAQHGQTGDGGGRAASGVTSVTSSLTFIDDGGEKAAGAGLEQFSINGLLVLEGVDEDAEDADATMRDELVMLARNSPLWKEELKRYLQREEKEREQMEKERAARLACWREDIIVQPVDGPQRST